MGETKRIMSCPKCGAENLSWRWRCQACNTLLHEDEETNAVKVPRRSTIEWLALILGVLGGGALAFLLWLILAFAKGRITEPMEWLIVVGTGLFAIGGVAVGWRRPLIGGGMLVVEGLLPISYFIWLSIQVGFVSLSLFLLIPGVLLLVAGILFILSRRKRQKPSVLKTE